MASVFIYQPASSVCAALARRRRSERLQRPRAATGRRKAVRRFRGLRVVPSGHLRTRWKSTLMANVVQDPRRIPRRSSATFRHRIRSSRSTRKTSPSPTAASGSSATSPRSATTTSSSPAQWDVSEQGLAPLLRRAEHRLVGADHYPADHMQRPTGPLCDGCHSVNYNIKTKDRHRVERRLREVPRRRQRARRSIRSRRRSSIPRGSTSCAQTTSASSATRRASR